MLYSTVMIQSFKSFGNTKTKKLILGDVVERSKSRRTRTLTAIFFPEQGSCSGTRPAKQGLSLSKQTAMGLWSCHREQIVKGACTVTQEARD